MAHKKAKSKSRKRSGTAKPKSRRRRMGATSAMNFSASSPLVKIAGAALGFLKPELIPVSKLVGDKVDPKIVAIGEGGLGFLLSQRKNKGRGAMATGMAVLSWYMIGAGVKKALQAFGIMSGISPYGRVPVIAGYSPYGRVPVIAGHKMNGYSPSGTLSGYTPSSSISKVMTGVGSESTSASGSGLMNNNAGSDYMN